MSTTLLQPKHVTAARDQAAKLAARVKAAHTNGEIKIMQDVERVFGIDLNSLTPDGSPWSEAGRQLPIQRWILDQILDKFVKDTGSRLQTAATLVTPQQRLRLTPRDQCYAFPNSEVTLFGEQDAVGREIIERFFKSAAPLSNILVPGGTGSGKTIIGAYAVRRALDLGYGDPPAVFPIPISYPIQWVTVSNAVEQTEEEIDRCGMGDELNRRIFVYGYNTLSCSAGLGRFTAVEETETAEFDGDADSTTSKRSIVWQPLAVPRFLVIDECHNLANEESGRSKIFLNLKKKLTQFPFFDTKVLWLSATPFEKVVDAKVFVSFADLNYGGMRITSDNFTTAFANPIAMGKPDVVTAASMERLFKALDKNVIEIPYVAWERKAINAVKFYKFECEEDRQYVAAAWERHVERCKAVGKDSPQGFGAVYASFTIFRKDVEHVRMPQIVREMYDNVTRDNNSSVCGTAFTGAVIKGIFLLLDKYGVSRDEISVIWGGRQSIKPERILDNMEMVQIVQQAIESGEGLTPENRRLIKRNLLWAEDKLLFGDEDANAQDGRFQRLKSLGLIGVQTKQRRLAEIAKMKSGQAKYCFFTMQSGGTGLSLPHADARTRPRVGWFTPIYSGKEFTQAFGRCPRRVSISDTYQYCCLLDGTIESEHVAPILDNKLRSAGAFTSKKTDLMAAMTDIFIKQKADFLMKREFGQGAVRDLDTVRQQALTDETTQYHGGGAVEEEDDDE